MTGPGGGRGRGRGGALARSRALACTLVLALAVASLLVPGCRRRGPAGVDRPSVIAMVGDEPVEDSAFAAYVRASAGQSLKDVSPQVASSLLDQYLDERLLERAVEAAVPKPTGATKAERRREVLARRAALDAVTDADLHAEYDAHPDRYRSPAAMRLSQLLLPTRDAAEKARKMLHDGVAWDEVSRTLSQAPNAASGGGLGLLTEADLPSEFARAVHAVPAGGLTGVIATGNAFHILRVEERTDGRTIPFEEARPSLRLLVAQERSSAALASLLSEARRRWPPAVVEERLPFAYVGPAARISLHSRP